MSQSLTQALDELEKTFRKLNPDAWLQWDAVQPSTICTCGHEILPPTKKKEAFGFTKHECRNDECNTKWWNRL